MTPQEDRDSAPWWEAVRRNELLLQKCEGCGTLRFPPRAICNACRCRDSSWTPASGTGRVYSWIVNHQRFMPDLPVPYTVVCVRLDDGPDLFMYGNLAEPTELRPDLPVTAELGDGLVLWRMAG